MVRTGWRLGGSVKPESDWPVEIRDINTFPGEKHGVSPRNFVHALIDTCLAEHDDDGHGLSLQCGLPSASQNACWNVNFKTHASLRQTAVRVQTGGHKIENVEHGNDVRSFNRL